MKKLFAMLCLVTLFVGMIPCISGATDIVPYASDVINFTDMALTAKDGKVYADATVKANAFASKIGFTSITLYHKIDGEWKVAASASQKFISNDGRYDYSVSCTLVSGREYKASCKAYVVVNGQSDTSSASAGPRTF